MLGLYSGKWLNDTQQIVLQQSVVQAIQVHGDDSIACQDLQQEGEGQRGCENA